MADDARISGINWRQTFPFTNLFRSFRIAIHPSKLALGLVALLSLYIGGRLLDRLWPARYLAVPGQPSEVVMYQEAGSRIREFRTQRWEHRMLAEAEYADLLVALNVEPDRAKALSAASDADRIGRVRRELIKRRDEAVKQADDALSTARSAADKNPDGAARKRMVDEAQRARDEAVRAAFRSADAKFDTARAVQGVGLFHELFAYEAAQVVGVIKGVTTFNWFGRRDAMYPITSEAADAMRTVAGGTPAQPHVGPEAQGVVRSLVNFFAVGPMWLMWEHTVYFLLFGLYFLAVWSVFGGAIARIAAVHVARDEKLSVRSALSFSVGKFLSFFSAPLIPMIIVLIVGLVPLVTGFLASIPVLGPIVNILMSILFVLLLACGFVMTLVLVGTLGGLNLMYPTIAAEGSDSFDAISRSFSYVYARPWRMLFYTLVAVTYGALTYLFVRTFIWLMLALTHRFVGAGMFAQAPSTDALWPTMWQGPSARGTLSYDINFLSLRWDQDVAAFFVALWVYLVVACLGAFAISFYFTANTIIYYLLRHEVDATDMDDVYLEQSDEDFGEAGTSVMPAAMSGGGTGAGTAASRAPDEVVVVREQTVIIEPPKSDEGTSTPPPAGADQQGASPAGDQESPPT